MGAKIAAHKSKLFSTHAPFREWLATKVWEFVNTQIPVVASFRDLGSTINITNKTATSVSRQRITSAIATVCKITNLPHHMNVKAMFARASALSKALYACEAAPVDEIMLRKLTKHLVHMLQRNAYQPSNAMVFALAGVGEDIDPGILILLRRAHMIRRMVCKHPELKQRIHEILIQYGRLEHKGMLLRDSDLATLKPSPPPGAPDRILWKQQ
eukprot:12422354-Karenia_brevis.AAC.1